MAFQIGLRLQGDPSDAVVAEMADDGQQELQEAAATAAAAAALPADDDDDDDDDNDDEGEDDEDKDKDSSGQECHVYVGNLSWQTSWQDIKDHFRSATASDEASSDDVVRADVAVGPDGRSKGFGTVVFKDTAAAERAIATYHDSELGGRLIVVRKDRQDQSQQQRSGAGGTASPPSVGGRRVYVNNLAWDVSWQDLKDHFRSYANGSGIALNVLRADVLQEPGTGRSRGCGLVELDTREAAQHSIATLNGSLLKGRALFVRADRDDFGEGGAAEGSRVYVGNLAWQVTWQDLKDLMATVGRVKRADVATKEELLPVQQPLAAEGGEGAEGAGAAAASAMGATGELEVVTRSRGYGLVTFETAAEASRAIEELNDVELKGRLIFVREDREASIAPPLATMAYGNYPGRGGKGFGGGKGAGGGRGGGKGYFGGGFRGHHGKGFGGKGFGGKGGGKGMGHMDPHPLQQSPNMMHHHHQLQHHQPQYLPHHHPAGGAFFGFGPPLGSGMGDMGSGMGLGGLGGGVGGDDMFQPGLGGIGGALNMQQQQQQQQQQHQQQQQQQMLVGGGGMGGVGGMRSAAGRQCFVGNLAPETTWRDLKDHFRRRLAQEAQSQQQQDGQGGEGSSSSSAGGMAGVGSGLLEEEALRGLERAEVVAFPNGVSRGYGTVRFATMQLAATAIRTVSGTTLQGRVIEVREDRQAV